MALPRLVRREILKNPGFVRLLSSQFPKHSGFWAKVRMFAGFGLATVTRS
jgi:hypothetical protein